MRREIHWPTPKPFILDCILKMTDGQSARVPRDNRQHLVIGADGAQDGADG